MRKILIVLALSIPCVCMFAQDNAAEREKGSTTLLGKRILPQTGDIAIGISATPILEYFGNFFNNTSNNGSGGDFFTGANRGLLGIQSQSVFGKYFLEDNVAVRARLTFDLSSNNQDHLVQKIGGDPGEMVANNTKNSTNLFLIDFGYEIRRGYGRLQGFFGPQVGIGFGTRGTTYTYGNELSKDNPNPHHRPLSESRFGFTFGIGGFAGVEYFILPKLSIGGEVALGLGYTHTGRGEAQTEHWSLSDNAVKNTTIETGGGGNFSFATAPTGVLSLTFHF